MGKLKLGAKIVAGFTSLILLTAIMAGASYYFLRGIMTATVNQTETSMAAQVNSTNMMNHSYMSTIYQLRYLYYNDSQYLDRIWKELKSAEDGTANIKTIASQYPVEMQSIKGLPEKIIAGLTGWGDITHKMMESRNNIYKNLETLENARSNAAKQFEQYSSNIEEQLRRDVIVTGRSAATDKWLSRLDFVRRCDHAFNVSMMTIWNANAINKWSDALVVGNIWQQFYDELTQVMIPQAVSPANLELLQQVEQSMLQFKSAFDNYIETSKQNEQIMANMRNLNATVNEDIEKMNHAIADDAVEDNQYVMGLVSTSQLIITIASLVILLIAIFIAVKITRMVTAPVKEVAHAFEQLVQRRFNISFSPVMLRRGDELGDLVRDLDNVCDSLSHAMREMNSASETVASASTQINQGNRDLSDRTQQQASGVEETASALEQMTGSVKNTAANASQASKLASKARRTAAQGGEVVEHTVVAMREVTESSHKINDIINVVNEIAFQTNLLALNAAVEAARAGEAGKGFAVVAGEVRNLAGRSADAAKQIQSLISDSVNKVESGNSLVAESGRLLHEIIGDVQKVADTIDEMNTAIQEQATGIDEINKAMAQMDQGIQQNAALVEEISASSDNLNQAASMALEQVQQFTIRERQRQKALP